MESSPDKDWVSPKVLRQFYSAWGNSGAAATGYTPNVAAHGEFYIGPETTGGLPVECDRFGNPVVVKGREQPTANSSTAPPAFSPG
jgi:hypothetical protein